ncbi:DUF2730 family protein [Rhodobacter capsulatus]|uniref:DUF2730 family protein n=1 Tax=Rhodobacter capsulatus TaxID=1061 RepID=UPI00402993FF
METNLLPLLNEGGIAGFLAVVAVLVLGNWLRERGKLASPAPGSAPGTAGELSSIRTEIADLDVRLTAVEVHMRAMPTRDDLHALQLNQATQVEKLNALDRAISATGAAVSRIEGFLLEVSQRGAK